MPDRRAERDHLPLHLARPPVGPRGEKSLPPPRRHALTCRLDVAHETFVDRLLRLTSLRARSLSMIHPGLDGRVALVTGANHGIGAAAVRLLIEQGARVFVT